MKTSIALITIAALAAKASASCFSEKIGYPCCSSTNEIVYSDDDGNWGIENNNWCGISEECWSKKLGYDCCKTTKKTVYTDDDGDWGIENGNWCGINFDSVIGLVPLTNTGNPFQGRKLYINPEYVKKVDNAITQLSDPSLIDKAEKMKEYSNAIWLDSINNMQERLETNLKRALDEQNQTGQEVLTVFVLYNIPGRNCHLLYPNGELFPNDDDLDRYKHEYIDVIEKTLMNYKNQQVVLIVEPDSLASIIINENIPACVESEKYYLEAHKYLLKKLGTLPHVSLYLDIGNSSTLGWDDYREKAAKLYSKVIKSGAPGYIRGFASNVANYTPWEDPEAYPNPYTRGPDVELNPYPDEKGYLQAIYKDFKEAGIKSIHFIEDTSRNGKKTERLSDIEWCNQTGYGAGARPQANPVPEMSYIDAFYWVKPLGESDGASSLNYKEYDGYCGHRTSMKPAPEWGEWFQAHFEQGIKDANPPLVE